MGWKFEANTPVFVQIADKIRKDIILRVYKPGEQLPSVRQLAADAAVNPNTVQRAMLLLEGEGLLCPKATVGLFVTSDEEAIDAARSAIKHQTVQRLFKEVQAIGITPEELISIVKENSFQ